MKKYKPLLDRIIVKQDPAPVLYPAGTSQIGLTIPEELRENFRPHTGLIVRVGPGQYVNGTFCPVALKEGQRILFAHPDTLTRVDHDGSEHLLMREADVFLVEDAEVKIEQKKDGARPQFCIEQAYSISSGQQAEQVFAVIDGKDAQTTYQPKSGDRFQTYDGLVFRTAVAPDKTGQVEILPERSPVFTNNILDMMVVSLQFHVQNRIPVAFIGPKLQGA
jgi:co-chaperonin GroES (HSP10)